MQKQPLAELIHDLKQEMLRLGYTKGSMQFYRRQWQSLLRFAQEQKETCFSERLGIDFLKKHFHIFVRDANRILSQSEIQKLRIIRAISDFQLHRSILRRYYKHEKILTEPYFISISTRFQSYCIDKDYSKVTIDHYVKQSARFIDYLALQNVIDCKKICIYLAGASVRCTNALYPRA